jgi:LysM repeat protein
MNRENSTTARILAALALIITVGAVIVVISSETGGGDDAGTPKGQRGQQAANNQNGGPAKPRKKVYVVQEGDTLTGIASSNGVSVARIEQLNPDLDPQALIPGQKLQLR